MPKHAPRRPAHDACGRQRGIAAAFLGAGGGTAKADRRRPSAVHRTTLPFNRRANGSGFARCPVCESEVAVTLMSDHMDGPRCVRRGSQSESVAEPGDNPCDETHRSRASGDDATDDPPAGLERMRDDGWDGQEPLRSDGVEHAGRTRGGDDEVSGVARIMRVGEGSMSATTTERPAEDGAGRPGGVFDRLKRASKASTKAAFGGGGGAEGAHRLPGHYLVPDFISEEEEAALLDFLDVGPEASRNPWKPSRFNGSHRGKRWGVEVDLKYRTVRPPRHAMPPLVLAIAEKIRRCECAGGVLRGFAPNEANAIDYDRAAGMELLPHVDDRQMSSDVLVNLSLAGDCTMTYVEERGRPGVGGARKSVDVYLPRRSLQVQSGQTRYNFAHSIKNENLHHPRRVSITFRESATPSSKTTVRGGKRNLDGQ